MTKFRAGAELLLADLFWGGAFVAAPIAQKIWPSAQISFIRFLIPTILGIILGFYYKKLHLNKKELIMGFIPGFLFAATIYSQTLGLEYTTPSRSSFITVLYVIFVPILEMFTLKKKFKPAMWLSVFGALIGMALLLNLNWSDWNRGDTLTFSCALFSTGHIYQVGVLGKKFRNPLLFNLSQCLWAAVFLLPFSLMSHGVWIPNSWDMNSTLALLFIIFGATIVAFSIQARVQMYLDATTSSIIFLLEAPIAMFGSWWILNESIKFIQIWGAFLILVSCLAAVKSSHIFQNQS